MDKQKLLLDILSVDLLSTVGDLRPEQIVLGERDHPRRTVPPSSAPPYVANSKSKHIMPEFCHVLNGKMSIKWENNFYCLIKGDYCFVPRMVSHGEFCMAPHVPYEVLWFGFPKVDRCWALHAEHKRDNSYHRHNIVHFAIPADMIRIFNDFGAAGRKNKTLIRQYLKSLFIVLSRKIERGSYFFPIIDTQKKSWRQRSLDGIEAYIQEHLCEKLTLKEIARRFSLSTRSLVTLFKLEWGDTVFEYIVRKRLEKSLTMLGTATLTISEIADQLYYKDVYFFSRQFKKYYGITPNEYRNKYLP